MDGQRAGAQVIEGRGAFPAVHGPAYERDEDRGPVRRGEGRGSPDAKRGGASFRGVPDRGGTALRRSPARHHREVLRGTATGFAREARAMMRALRLYSPFYVLIVWTILIAFGLDSSEPLTT